jgi:hypothetical protein
VYAGLHARFRSGWSEIGIARLGEPRNPAETVWNDRLAIVRSWCSHTDLVVDRHLIAG